MSARGHAWPSVTRGSRKSATARSRIDFRSVRLAAGNTLSEIVTGTVPSLHYTEVVLRQMGAARCRTRWSSSQRRQECLPLRREVLIDSVHHEAHSEIVAHDHHELHR